MGKVKGNGGWMDVGERREMKRDEKKYEGRENFFFFFFKF